MASSLPLLPPRPSDGHKGTFGTVCVIGGQAAEPRVMLGGPAFAAAAALRVGAGLAVLAVPSPLLAPALVVAPSATGLALPVDAGGALLPSQVAELLDRHAAAHDCLVIGPGLGVGRAQQQIVARLVAAGELPMVIDADAINALAALPDFHRDFRAPAVLTPHLGEFRRIAAALGIEADPVDPQQRSSGAEQLARRLGCVVVLKGAGTVVTDGLTTVVNTTGNPALATAGTGDVLAGVIGGLIAQFFKPSLGVGTRQVTAQQQGGLSLHACATLGVHLHGLAADAWAAERGDAGLLAADLLDRLPEALNTLRN